MIMIIFGQSTNKIEEGQTKLLLSSAPLFCRSLCQLDLYMGGRGKPCIVFHDDADGNDL